MNGLGGRKGTFLVKLAHIEPDVVPVRDRHPDLRGVGPKINAQKAPGVAAFQCFGLSRRGHFQV